LEHVFTTRTAHVLKMNLVGIISNISMKFS